MVLTYSRSGSYDVTDDVIRYNHCRNIGAKYLGKTRSDCGMVSTDSLYKLAYKQSIVHALDDVT